MAVNHTKPHMLNVRKYVCENGTEFLLPEPTETQRFGSLSAESREVRLTNELVRRFPTFRSERRKEPTIMQVTEYCCLIEQDSVTYRKLNEYTIEAPLGPLNAESYAEELSKSLPFSKFPQCLQDFVTGVVSSLDLQCYESMLCRVEEISDSLKVAIEKLDSEKKRKA